MARPKTKIPLVLLPARVPEQQLQWLRDRAEHGGIGVGEVVRRIFADEIAREAAASLSR